MQETKAPFLSSEGPRLLRRWTDYHAQPSQTAQRAAQPEPKDHESERGEDGEQRKCRDSNIPGHPRAALHQFAPGIEGDETADDRSVLVADGDTADHFRCGLQGPPRLAFLPLRRKDLRGDLLRSVFRRRGDYDARGIEEMDCRDLRIRLPRTLK